MNRFYHNWLEIKIARHRHILGDALVTRRGRRLGTGSNLIQVEVSLLMLLTFSPIRRGADMRSGTHVWRCRHHCRETQSSLEPYPSPVNRNAATLHAASYCLRPYLRVYFGNLQPVEPHLNLRGPNLEVGPTSASSNCLLDLGFNPMVSLAPLKRQRYRNLGRLRLACFRRSIRLWRDCIFFLWHGRPRLYPT